MERRPINRPPLSTGAHPQTPRALGAGRRSGLWSLTAPFSIYTWFPSSQKALNEDGNPLFPAPSSLTAVFEDGIDTYLATALARPAKAARGTLSQIPLSDRTRWLNARFQRLEPLNFYSYSKTLGILCIITKRLHSIGYLYNSSLCLNS